jgi:chemotaxis signal transduction protein
MTRMMPAALTEKEILARRAEKLCTALPPLAEEERVLLAAAISFGDLTFAFALSALRGVLPLRMVTPVPLAWPVVIGVTRFQGQLITVLSLASLLGGAWKTDPSNILVLKRGDGALAVDCAEIPRMVALPSKGIEVTGGMMTPALTVEGELVHLLDPALMAESVRELAHGA